jgi:endonuclease/exonuclease/phosphatase family metal-dependent hydrolase
MDKEDGRSRFLRDFADTMGAVDYRADMHEKSWLVEGLYYGNAIVSRLPLKEYQTFKLPNPRFEIDNPDGSHWFLHDKTVQYATVDVNGTPVRLFNLHYFPFHRFKHNMNEPELKPIRKEFIQRLRLEDGIPTILAGDFNNGDDDLAGAYPELFEEGKLADAVTFGREEFDDYYTNDKFQLDHILYTSRDFRAIAGRVVRDPSDHRGIVVDLELV